LPINSPQVAYRESEALKRQDLLIAEELELQHLDSIKRKEQAERERKKKAEKKVCLQKIGMMEL
jgi:hypothetical protein